MNITLDDGRTELWQWDTGRKIVVDDKSVSEVHYSKYSSTQAITREVINGKAEIPNFLLQDTHAVTVYAYSGSIENGYTMAEKTFNVVKKPKPANYVETEEDKAILAKLKAEIGNLSELQTGAKDNLVKAINEAATSASWNELKDKPFYLEKTLVVELTKDDFVPDNEGHPFYTSSPKLDWMTSIDNVSIELNRVYNNGTSYVITENSPGIYIETIYEDDGREYINFGDDKNFGIYSGPEDSFSIIIWDSYENLTEIHLALYRKYVKKIPGSVVDAAIGKTAFNIFGWKMDETTDEDVFVEVPEISIPVDTAYVLENEVFYDIEEKRLRIPATIMPWYGTYQLALNYGLLDTVGSDMVFSFKEGDTEWEFFGDLGNRYAELLFYFIPSSSLLSFLVKKHGSRTVTALATSEAGYVYRLKYTYNTVYNAINGIITRII